MYDYGFDAYAATPGRLPDRAAAVDQPFGAGRVILIASNPFYRAWLDGMERLVGNGILYPLGAQVSPSATAEEAAAAAQPKAAPVAAAKLKAVNVTTRGTGKTIAGDVLIRVKRSQSAQLKAAVAKAHLSKAIQRKVTYKYTRTTATLLIRRVRTENEHARAAWVVRIMDGLAQRKVRALAAQL